MIETLPPIVVPKNPDDRGLPKEPKWLRVPSETELRRQPWVNWSGSQIATPEYIVAPSTEEEVVEVVRRAMRDGLPIRPVGGGYSFSPLVPTTGTIVDMRRLSGVVSVDLETSRAVVRPGTQILELGGLLWELGLSMTISGFWDRQTIGGAISTGTHGSSKGVGCISSFVTRMKLVDGHGNLVEIGEKDVTELAAAQVSLGLLGIITEIELQCEPRFFLDRKVSQPSWPEVEENLDEYLAHDYFASFWSPHSGSAARYGLPVPDGLDMEDRTWSQVYDKVAYDPALETTERSWFDYVGRGYHSMTVDAPGVPSFHEMEYMVPVEQAMDALGPLQQIIREMPQPQFPLLIRWVKGDDAMISPFAGRDSVCFSTSGVPGTDYWPFLKAFHDILAPLDPRGHWGKIHLFDREYLERVYPRHGEFVEVRRRFDPKGIFLNDHTRSLFA